MAYQFILTEQKDSVFTITLNRPEVFNALNDEITYELQDALKQAKDESVRVVILTGAGKAFCSGQDLKTAPLGKSYQDSIQKRYNPIIRAMRQLPKPIIGKLNGVAAGAGASLILACDIIYAAPSAYLTEAFINIDLVPDAGSSWLLPRQVGIRKAFEWCTQGNRISMNECIMHGLINKICDDLDGDVEDIADYYANAPTKAIGMIKKMMQKSMHTTLDDMLDYEGYCQEIASKTEDHKEGVMAFIQKREPKFSGK